jgi:hypothetical protein
MLLIINMGPFAFYIVVVRQSNTFVANLAC